MISLPHVPSGRTGHSCCWDHCGRAPHSQALRDSLGSQLTKAMPPPTRLQLITDDRRLHRPGISFPRGLLLLTADPFVGAAPTPLWGLLSPWLLSPVPSRRSRGGFQHLFSWTSRVLTHQRVGTTYLQPLEPGVTLGGHSETGSWSWTSPPGQPRGPSTDDRWHKSRG